MADEITVQLRVQAEKGGISVDSGQVRVTIDMTGVDMAGWMTQSVGTSAEALAVPDDLGFPAHIAIQNLDATNFVEVFQDSGGTYQVCKLRAGDPPCLLVGIAAVPYVKANTAACLIKLLPIEQ